MDKSKELIFVDTGVFFALKSIRDEFHDQAVEYKNKLLFKGSRIKLVTIKPVLYESLNLAKKKLGAKYSIELGEMFYQTKFIEIYNIDEEIEKAGWEIFRKYKDQEYSFTDCTSFAFMHKNNIKKAFAFDEHFKQFGFEMVK